MVPCNGTLQRCLERRPKAALDVVSSSRAMLANAALCSGFKIVRIGIGRQCALNERLCRTVEPAHQFFTFLELFKSHESSKPYRSPQLTLLKAGLLHNRPVCMYVTRKNPHS
jgi:hypothetical protein